MKLFIFAILLVSIIGIDAIVNGKLANLAKYPWYATIEFPLYKHITIFACAATIISEDTLLTTARCLPPLSKKNNLISHYDVVIKGSNEHIKIKDYYPHPDFDIINSTWYVHDIAIVKLDKKIKFNQYVQPVCLSTQEVRQYLGPLDVAGFGHQKVMEGIGSTVFGFDPYLKTNFTEAKVYDRTQKLCPDDKNRLICVDSDDKQGTCLGDQGSGLLFNDLKNGKPYVVGVNSWNFPKQIDEYLYEICSSGSYATRLSSYKQFIDKYAGDYCSVE